MSKIELGVTAKDKITGFEGVVTGHARYLTGCDQYVLNPAGLDKDGKLKESHWFDENRLELVKGKKKITIDTDKVRGGPQRDCPGKQA